MALSGLPLPVLSQPLGARWPPFIRCQMTVSTTWMQRMRSTNINIEMDCGSNVAWGHLCCQAVNLMQWHSAKETFVFFSKTRMGRCAEKSIAEGSGRTSSFPRTLCKPEAPFGSKGNPLCARKEFHRVPFGWRCDGPLRCLVVFFS